MLLRGVCVPVAVWIGAVRAEPTHAVLSLASAVCPSIENGGDNMTLLHIGSEHQVCHRPSISFIQRSWSIGEAPRSSLYATASHLTDGGETKSALKVSRLKTYRMGGFVFNAVELLGFAGGILLSVSLVPQIVRCFRSWSTTDLCYPWMLVDLAGLIMNTTYCFLVGAVAGGTMAIVESLCMGCMLGLKLAIDGLPSWRGGAGNGPGAPGKPHAPSPQLTEVGAARHSRRPSLEDADKETDVCRRSHFAIDGTFTSMPPADFEHELMNAVLHAAEESGVHVVNHAVETFVDAMLPPGFAAVALLAGGGHVSAHCDTNQGLVMVDIFSCGADPERAQGLASAIHVFLESKFGPDASFDVRHISRFAARTPK
mmetsp:Transcript_105774/g.331535  ORF Transcript_105774/g.331535 Transcript_105774/m.331535 type:complete len:370 (-) Transcript_105774:133-1242(-)